LVQSGLLLNLCDIHARQSIEGSVNENDHGSLVMQQAVSSLSQSLRSWSVRKQPTCLIRSPLQPDGQNGGRARNQPPIRPKSDGLYLTSWQALAYGTMTFGGGGRVAFPPGTTLLIGCGSD
jgi:hypothetical protein